MRAANLNNLRREYANFRPDLEARAARARAKRARKRSEREDRDDDHLAMIRGLPCTVCERSPPRHAIHEIGRAHV